MNKHGCSKLIGLCVLIVFAVLQFTGCTTANPQTRVQQNPALFNQLSAQDRDLVLKGTISEGMTKDAVFLAWGRPDAVSTGSDRGKATETWRYATMRPVYYGAGFGYGMGHHGGRYYGRGYYPGWGVGITPQYVPVTSSVAKFRGARVVAWEASDR